LCFTIAPNVKIIVKNFFFILVDFSYEAPLVAILLTEVRNFIEKPSKMLMRVLFCPLADKKLKQLRAQ